MTTYVNARDALVAHVNAGWTAGFPSVKVFYENTTKVDLDTVGSTFLTVAIDFDDAMQADIDIDEYDPTVAPGDAVYGEVSFRLFVKDGQGTRAVLQMFDFLSALMRHKRISGVTTGVPTPGRKEARDGWASFDLSVPFSFYSKD